MKKMSDGNAEVQDKETDAIFSLMISVNSAHSTHQGDFINTGGKFRIKENIQYQMICIKP